MVALWNVARMNSFSPVAAPMPVTIECSSKVRVRTKSDLIDMQEVYG